MVLQIVLDFPTLVEYVTFSPSWDKQQLSICHSMDVPVPFLQQHVGLNVANTFIQVLESVKRY
jgi:hypothetical protein